MNQQFEDDLHHDKFEDMDLEEMFDVLLEEKEVGCDCSCVCWDCLDISIRDFM